MRERLKHLPTPELDLRVLREHARDEGELEAFVARRAMGEPVAQIVGNKGFWTLELKVTKDVLTPRPDTETILDALLRHRPDKAKDYRVLDLGTGSGCIVLSVLSEYPNATGVAVDVSAEALSVARENAVVCGVVAGLDCFAGARNDGDRLRLVQGEWCAPLAEGERFDIIVSNPPYIPSAEIAGLEADVRVFEPMLALDGGEDGLDCYRTLAMQIPSRMVDEAVALLEVGAGQAQDVAEIMKRSGLAVLEIAKDLAGIERTLVLMKRS